MDLGGGNSQIFGVNFFTPEIYLGKMNEPILRVAIIFFKGVGE